MTVVAIASFQLQNIQEMYTLNNMYIASYFISTYEATNFIYRRAPFFKDHNFCGFREFSVLHENCFTKI